MAILKNKKNYLEEKLKLKVKTRVLMSDFVHY